MDMRGAPPPKLGPCTLQGGGAAGDAPGWRAPLPGSGLLARPCARHQGSWSGEAEGEAEGSELQGTRALTAGAGWPAES
jgi:hypothetical protein